MGYGVAPAVLWGMGQSKKMYRQRDPRKKIPELVRDDIFNFLLFTNH